MIILVNYYYRCLAIAALLASKKHPSIPSARIRIHGLSSLVSLSFLPFVSLDGSFRSRFSLARARCATHGKSIRGDKNLIPFVIHLFDEAYKCASRAQDRTPGRPFEGAAGEQGAAGMMDDGTVNKMKRAACGGLFAALRATSSSGST